MNEHPGYYDYLRIGKLAGSLSHEELAEFQELITKDADFREAFSKLKQQLPSETLHALIAYKDDDEWQDVPGYFKQPAPVKTIPWLKIAAAIVVALGLGAIFFLPGTGKKDVVAVVSSPHIQLRLASGKTIDLSSARGAIDAGPAIISNTGETLSYNSSDENSGMNSLTVAPGMDYQITLGDGSKVWLNSSTTLEFPFTFKGSKREIFIRGEAYLEVAKDSKMPFIVRLPESEVEVLGTAFNVNSYDSGINTVSLVNGSVDFKASTGNIRLQPGKQGIYRKNKDLYQQSFDSRTTLSWKKGLYYFDQAPLEEIARIIPRWFNVNVVIDNDRNNDKRIVGAVDKNKPLDVFLNDLKEVSDIQSYFDKNGLLHFK